MNTTQRKRKPVTKASLKRKIKESAETHNMATHNLMRMHRDTMNGIREQLDKAQCETITAKDHLAACQAAHRMEVTRLKVAIADLVLTKMDAVK